MEFDRLVSSLDAEDLARAAEALLRALSGEGTGKAPSLPGASPEREARTDGFFPLSAPEAAEPLSGAGDGDGRSGAAEGEAEFSLFSPAAAPGGTAADGVRVVKGHAALSSEAAAERGGMRPGALPERGPRAPGQEQIRELKTAAEPARLEERPAAVSERNRSIPGAGTETFAAYLSPDGSAAPGGDAAAGVYSPVRSAPPPGGAGAAADLLAADTESAPFDAGAAAGRSFFDAEAVSEFFRRDSRRYDSGFSD